jgi:hypothetical protein
VIGLCVGSSQKTHFTTTTAPSSAILALLD